jgi:hypothetical protein
MSEATYVNQIEPFPQPQRSTTIADELGKLLDQVKSEFPKAVNIIFEFDGKLKLHVDVRAGEEISTAEARLGSLCGGTFTNIHHGATPHHPFFHRVTAEVPVWVIEVVNGLRDGLADTRRSLEILEACRAHFSRRAEMQQQRTLARRADAGDLVERAGVIARLRLARWAPMAKRCASSRRRWR